MNEKEQFKLLLDQLGSELRGISGIAGVLRETGEEPYCFAGEGIENAVGDCFDVVEELGKMAAKE